MGFINILNKKYDEAVENGEKAVRINPNDPIMISILSSIMVFSGKLDESIALMKNAMRLCPFYPAYFLNSLVLPYLSAGRYEEALEPAELLLDRAKKGEFSRYSAYMNLAEAYAGLGREEKARAYAEEILKINPNYSLANQRKRWYYYKDPAHVDRRIDALRKAGLK